VHALATPETSRLQIAEHRSGNAAVLARRTQSLLSMLKLAMVFETFEDEESAVRRYAFSTRNERND